MNAAPPILPGLDIVACAGEGGMSTVWKAYSHRLNAFVAVKILKPELMSNSEDVELFVGEAETMKKIDHPGIVKCYGLANAQGLWYYTMEFVDGYNFGALLQRKQHLSEEDCLGICESVSVALDYAWNVHGIVHCDIKPDNIMINTSGEVKITDLGLSRIFAQAGADQRQGVQPDQVLGTPAYISPEQVFGDVQIDCRADIYSLAASLYHLSTGRVLFPGRDASEMMRAHCDNEASAVDPRTYNSGLSLGFCQLLEAMLVKDRSARIQSWKDVYAMCRDVESGVQFMMRDTAFPSSMKIS